MSYASQRMSRTTNAKSRLVLVTGGNSGVGKATATELLRRGTDVAITARDAERGAAAVRDITLAAGRAPELYALDLASFASVSRFAEDFLARHAKLDVLIHNAGLTLSERRSTEDGLEMTLQVNHLGPFLLTRLLLGSLLGAEDARIVLVASHAHFQAFSGLRFDDLMSTGRYSGMLTYARSKLANIYFARELSRRLAGTGVTVNAVHPGSVASGFGGDGDAKGVLGLALRVARPFMISPEKGAETVVYAAVAEEIRGVTGRYFARSREALPSRVARDEAAARRLFELSLEYTKRPGERLGAPWIA